MQKIAKLGYCLRILNTAPIPNLKFKIHKVFSESSEDRTSASSSVIACNQVQFNLDCSFAYTSSYAINMSIKFLKIHNNKEQDLILFALIVMDYSVISNYALLESKENLIQKLTFPNTVYKLDPVNLGPFESMQEFEFSLKIKFIKVFDYSSTLFFCLGPVTKAPYFKFLNSKEVSNTSFKLQDRDNIIWVNTQIICNECAFFEKMLQKEWLRDADKQGEQKHIKMKNWSDKGIIAVILHLYTGWLPGSPISDEVYKKLNIVESEFTFDFNSWLELVDIADMIELHGLAVFAAIAAKKSVSTKIDSFFDNLISNSIA